MTESSPPADLPQDPRVERTRTHVLRHARELLSSRGPSAVTYSNLAARARVTRQTLYRHWPNREALFVDLVLEQSMDGVPTGSGSPEQIVSQFLRRFRDDMNDCAHASPLVALIAMADHEAASSSALAEVNAAVRDVVNTLLRPHNRSITSEDYARLCGPLIFQRFIAREPVSDRFIDALVSAWSQAQTPSQACSV